MSTNDVEVRAEVVEGPERGRGLAALEAMINGELERAWTRLMADPERCAHYDALFDRASEEQFYADPQRVQGKGEQPTWQPNPAYMDSLEELWSGCESLLASAGVALDRPLRQAFFDSREYRDFADVHRRVFVGQLVGGETRSPETLYLLTVGHSHSRFDYSEPPKMHISPTLSRQHSTADLGDTP